MIEIEAKVWLDNKKISHKDILYMMRKNFKYIGEKVKHDWYFSKESIKNSEFRVRLCNKKYCVTYKNRYLEKGIELNEENEFFVNDFNIFKGFVAKFGYKISIEKVKKTFEFQYNNYCIELNHINKLGWFLEIETLAKNKLDIKLCKKYLLEIFQSLGFTEKDFESRRYIELLNEQKKEG